MAALSVSEEDKPFKINFWIFSGAFLENVFVCKSHLNYRSSEKGIAAVSSSNVALET
jgi:hypothetical protein